MNRDLGRPVGTSEGKCNIAVCAHALLAIFIGVVARARLRVPDCSRALLLQALGLLSDSWACGDVLMSPGVAPLLAYMFAVMAAGVGSFSDPNDRLVRPVQACHSGARHDSD